jgi:hypothetical protein
LDLVFLGCCRGRLCCNLPRRNMIAVVEHNSSRRSAQVEMKDVVVIILVVVVKEKLQCWRLPSLIILYLSFRPFVNQSFCESRFGSLSHD